MHQEEPRTPDSEEISLGRRSLLGSIFGFLVLAQPLGTRLFASLEVQPLIAQVSRLVEAMAYLGEPLSDADRERITAAASRADGARALEEIQQILDPRCLVIPSRCGCQAFRWCDRNGMPRLPQNKCSAGKTSCST